MNEPEPVDLSALDPERNPEHWAAVIAATRLRVAAVLRGREADPFAVLVAWNRHVLAAAATLLVLLGFAVATWGGHRAPAASELRRLAYLAESSVLHGRAPDGALVWAAIQGQGSRR